MWAEFLSDLGGYKLFDQLISLSLTLAPLVAGLMVAYHMIMRMKADDERLAAQHMRSVRTTLVVTAIIVSSGQLLFWALHFTDLVQPTKPCYGFIWKDDAKCP